MKPMTPCFAAQYADSSGSPRMPPADETATNRPCRGRAPHSLEVDRQHRVPRLLGSGPRRRTTDDRTRDCDASVESAEPIDRGRHRVVERGLIAHVSDDGERPLVTATLVADGA
jgi:hypothetical protein